MTFFFFFQVKRNISNRLSVVFSRTLASAGKELKDNFLKALAEREEANRSGKMTVSTLLQHSNCYVMGFPSNISAIPLGWEQNPYCVKLTGKAPCPIPPCIPWKPAARLSSIYKTLCTKLPCPWCAFQIELGELVFRVLSRSLKGNNQLNSMILPWINFCLIFSMKLDCYSYYMPSLVILPYFNDRYH